MSASSVVAGRGPAPGHDLAVRARQPIHHSRFTFHASGFTLIELMLVCLLIGILTAMIIPEMKGTYEDALLRSTSRKLIDAFDLANSQAVSLNQLDRVRLDTRAGRFAVEQQIRDGGRQHFVPLRIAGGEGRWDGRISVHIRAATTAATDEAVAGSSSAGIPPPDDSSGSGAGDAIEFYPDGTADAREIVLRDRDGFGLALRINPITARVNVVTLERR